MGSRGRGDARPARPLRASHESIVFFQAIAAGAPAVAAALILLAQSEVPAKNAWTIALAIVGCWIGFASAARERVARPLQTIANLIGAVREGDFSFRGRHASGDDALADAMREVNALAASLREKRLEAIEASA